MKDYQSNGVLLVDICCYQVSMLRRPAAGLKMNCMLHLLVNSNVLFPALKSNACVVGGQAKN